jgi:hypothetical protein
LIFSTLVRARLRTYLNELNCWAKSLFVTADQGAHHVQCLLLALLEYQAPSG